MKRYRRRKKAYRALLAAAVYLLLAAGAATAFWQADSLKRADSPPPIAAAMAPVSPAAGAGRENGGLPLISQNAILFDPEDGRVLFGKNARDRAYPASLTKLMTALVAVERIADFDAPVALVRADYAGLYEQNAAMAGFVEGETVTARDLLYATLLPSGAEAACALARVAAGSKEDCVALMNARAEALGMADSHFMNVTGLHDDAHYTTVYDLSLLLTAALKNDLFTEVFSTFGYTTTATAQHPQGLTLTSTLTPRVRQLGRDAAPITGAKTGYTEEAQLCLASVGAQNGLRRAVITIGAEGDGYSEPTHLEDAYLLYQKSLPG